MTNPMNDETHLAEVPNRLILTTQFGTGGERKYSKMTLYRCERVNVQQVPETSEDTRLSPRVLNTVPVSLVFRILYIIDREIPFSKGTDKILQGP